MAVKGGRASLGTMKREIVVSRIGREHQSLITIDGFAPDPDALRTAAIAAKFEPASEHYPGVQAPLPASYLRDALPLIASTLAQVFGRCRRIHVIDASFSIVTTPPAALAVQQRLPHVDAFGPERVALVHYLSLHGGDGTAFFRHRATGFETIDAERSRGYLSCLGTELGKDAPPASYIAGDTPLFERTAIAEARYNRALLYRSYVLHSGAISPDAALSPDPQTGRLTITAFLSIE